MSDDLMLPGFYFWMVINTAAMGVDNSSINTMDFSSLPADVSMIHWQEGRGEIELNSGPALHTIFYDVSPYCPLFQQFMTKLTGLTLAQAQKIQTDLVSMLYNNKRQLPINYTVSAGNYNWSTLDADIAAMSMEAIPFITGSSSSMGSDLSGSIQALANSVNAMINVLNGSVIGTINGSVVDALNAGVMNAGYFLLASDDGSQAYAAGPGLSGAMPQIPTVPQVSVDGGGNGGGAADIPWYPMGAYEPVNLTMADMTGLMSAISARRSQLLFMKNWKSQVIAGYPTIEQVIDYSVTAGW